MGIIIQRKMYFEPILKTKQEIRYSTNETHSDQRVLSYATSGYFPTTNNPEPVPQQTHLKKSNSLSQLKSSNFKASFLARTKEAFEVKRCINPPTFGSDKGHLRNDGCEPDSKEQAFKHFQLSGKGRNEFQSAYKTYPDKKRSSIPLDQLLESNRALLEKCEGQDRQIQNLKIESKKLRESQLARSQQKENNSINNIKSPKGNTPNQVKHSDNSIEQIQSQSFYRINSPLALHPKSPTEISCGLDSFEASGMKDHFRNTHPFKKDNLIEEIDRLLNEKESERLKRRQLEEQCDRLKGNKLEFEISNDKLRFENESLKKRISALQKEQQKAKKNTVPNREEFEHQLQAAEAEKNRALRELDSKVCRHQDEKNQWNLEKKNLLMKLQEIKKQRSDLQTQKTTLSEKVNQLLLNKQPHSEQQWERLTQQSRNLAELKEEKKRIEEEFSVKQEKLIEIISNVENQMANEKQKFESLQQDYDRLQKEKAIIENVVSQMGEKVSNHDLIVSKMLEDHNQAIEKLNNQIHICRQEIQALKKNVRAKDAVIRDKREIIKQFETESSKKQQKIAALESELSEASKKNQQTIEEHTSIHLIYKKQLQSLQNTLGFLQNKLKANSSQEDHKRADFDHLALTNQRLTEQLRQSEIQINRLRSIIDETNELSATSKRQSNTEKQRLSYQLSQVQQQLQLIKKQFTEKEQTFKTNLHQIFGQCSDTELLAEINKMLDQLHYLRTNSLNELYIQILDLFDVNIGDETFHQKLLGEISNFHSNQSIMVSKLKGLERRLEQYQKQNMFFRGLLDENEIIKQGMTHSLQLQNQQIMKMRALNSNNNFK